MGHDINVTMGSQYWQACIFKVGDDIRQVYVRIYMLLLICFARIDFSEQSHVEGEGWDVTCDERTIFSQIYQG